MSKKDKLAQKIMSGEHDGNVSFDELCRFLTGQGFVRRNTGGSHNVFERGSEPALNIQEGNNGSAKRYQLRQVREHLTKYGLSS